MCVSSFVGGSNVRHRGSRDGSHRHRGDDDHALHGELQGPGDAVQVEQGEQRLQRQRAGHRGEHGAAAAAEHHPAEHDRGDGRNSSPDPAWAETPAKPPSRIAATAAARPESMNARVLVRSTRTPDSCRGARVVADGDERPAEVGAHQPGSPPRPRPAGSAPTTAAARRGRRGRRCRKSSDSAPRGAPPVQRKTAPTEDRAACRAW